MLDKIDAVIMSNASFRAPKRANPREKELPTNRKGVKVKIPRVMVNLAWLVRHPDSNTPLRLEDFEEEDCMRQEGEDEEWEEGGDQYSDTQAEEVNEEWDGPDGQWPIDPYLYQDEI